MLSRRTVTIAEALGDKRALAGAKALLGLALLPLWQRAEGRQVLEEAIGLAKDVGDPAVLGSALNNAAWAYEIDGELHRSIDLYRQGKEAAEREGNPDQVTLISSSLARTAFLSGDWAMARQYANEAIEMARALDAPRMTSYPLLARGSISLAQGDWDAAERDLHEALAIAVNSHDRQATTSVSRMLAELDLVRGHPDRAREHLLAGGVPDAWDPDVGDSHLNVRITLARVYRDLGEFATARNLLLAVISKAQDAGELLIVPEALTVLGTVATLEEDWEAAERAFDEALKLAQRIEYPWAEAQTLYAWGMMHSRNGDRDQARSRVGEALAIFHRLGARRHEVEAEQRLAELKDEAGSSDTPT